METREFFSDHYKSIAFLQYEKHFQPQSSLNNRSAEITRNIQQALLPQRKFKKISKSNISSENQLVRHFKSKLLSCNDFSYLFKVTSTLMEYGVVSTYIADTEDSQLQVCL